MTTRDVQLNALHILGLGSQRGRKKHVKERMLLAAVKHNTSNRCYENVLLLHFIIISLDCYYMDILD